MVRRVTTGDFRIANLRHVNFNHPAFAMRAEISWNASAKRAPKARNTEGVEVTRIRGRRTTA